MSAEAAQAIRHALALLEAASADSRLRGPSDGSTPLHWPIAVAAARAQLTHALALLPISKPPSAAGTSATGGIITANPTKEGSP